MHSKPSAGLALALFTVGGFIAAPSAFAQAELDLGQNGSTALAGTATLGSVGTTASGTYQYYSGGTPTPFDPTRTTYNQLYTYGPSIANVSGGGRISDFLYSYNTSMVNVNGGAVGSFRLHDTSTASIGSGSVAVLFAFDNSTADVSGGNFTQGLYTYNSGTLDLFGTGFTETVVDTEPTYTQYEVKGTLQNGDPLDVSYFDEGGKLILSSPVPEASSFVSLGLLLLLGVGGLAVSRRCKAGAAR